MWPHRQRLDPLDGVDRVRQLQWPVLRVWCLAVLLCLSLCGAASGTTHDPVAAPHDVTVLDDASPRDDSSNRSWEAVRPAACPTGSSWTSQMHHAVLARTLCYPMVRATLADDVRRTDEPRALRAQFQTPLLI